MVRITHFQAIGYEGAYITANGMRFDEDRIRAYIITKDGERLLTFDLHREGALHYDVELREAGLSISHVFHWPTLKGVPRLSIHIVREAIEQPPLLIEDDSVQQGTSEDVAPHTGDPSLN